MLMRAVQEKIAREVPINRKAAFGFRRKANNKPDGAKWFLHIPSQQVWELVWIDVERSGTWGFFRPLQIKPPHRKQYRA